MSFSCICTNLRVSVKVVVFRDEFSVILLLMIKHLFLTRPVASCSNMFLDMQILASFAQFCECFEIEKIV